MKKTDKSCALYRSERVGDSEYYSIKEYCDGLETPFYCNAGIKCPFYKSAEEWRPIIVRKQTQYVRIE